MSVRSHVAGMAVVGAIAISAAAGTAAAQSLGTFTWQLQPFCNRVIVSVTQAGAIYTLDGYDDQCGAAQRAPLVGLATPNPDGTIGLGFHIATSPGGKTVSVESRVSLASIGGPWTDSAGNSGTFVLNGSVAGSPRPAPPAAGVAPGSVTAAALAPGAVTNVALAVDAVSSANIIDGTVGAADVNSAEVQRRILSGCVDGSFLSGVDTDGTPKCSVGTTRSASVALGSNALGGATSGGANVAVGTSALRGVSPGNGNVAIGAVALADSTGSNNIAIGVNAISTASSGFSNVAVGWQAMYQNSAGSNNVAVGQGALRNSSASENIAVGVNAMFSATGNTNTAVGYVALVQTSGTENIALGHAAGNTVTTGSNNIHIGNVGIATDSATIKIGTQGTQTRAFVAGVRGITTGSATGIAVLVDANGQLGTVSSSRRFKDDIADMGDASSAVLKLRPVTFRYKQSVADGSKPLDYGLIAEEVAEVFPDLAVRGADGQIETVAYHKLPALLLNELQKQQRVIQAQAEGLTSQAAALAAQARDIDTLRTAIDELRADRARMRRQRRGGRSATQSVVSLFSAVRVYPDSHHDRVLLETGLSGLKEQK